MQRYRVRENLDEYEDDLEDQYEDDDEDQYEDEEDEEAEEREQPRSEEEIKFLQLREKLKAKHRSNLRRENGKNAVNIDPSKLLKFNFFGPSEPAIAKRVLEQRQSLLETRHLGPKASTSQSDVKKVSLPSTAASRNGSSDRAIPSQVKSKVQIIKQTRDYSWLMSEDAEIPKPATDSGPKKNLPSKPDFQNGRSAQVPAKRSEFSSLSSKKGYDVRDQRKPSTGTSHGRDDHGVPPLRSSSSDSRRQLELRKQSLPNKHVGSNSGSSSRSSVQKVLPSKKPLSSNDRKMPVGSIEKKLSGSSIGNRAPGVTKASTYDRQKPHVVKAQASGSNRADHRKDVQRSSENKMFKKENVMASKSQIVKQPNQTSRHSNMEKGNFLKKQKPATHLQKSPASSNKNHQIKKRKSPHSDPELDISSVIKKMFGYDRARYCDIDDDDDDCMEVNFEDIEREERRSAKIAKREDDEEFIKIQEEERLEREAALRRRKKLKMNKR